MSLAGDTALNALLKCINLSVYGQYVDLCKNKSIENVVFNISLKATNIAASHTLTHFGKWLTNFCILFGNSIQKLQKYTKSRQILVNHLYTFSKMSECAESTFVR